MMQKIFLSIGISILAVYLTGCGRPDPACSRASAYHFEPLVDEIVIKENEPFLAQFVFYPSEGMYIEYHSNIEDQIYLSSKSHEVKAVQFRTVGRESSTIKRLVSRENPINFSVLISVKDVGGKKILDFGKLGEINKWENDLISIRLFFHPALTCFSDSGEAYISNKLQIVP